MSLRLRLTLFYTLFLALVLVAVAAAVYAFTQRSLVTALEDRAHDTVMSVVADKRLASAPQLPDDAYWLVKAVRTSSATPERLRNIDMVSAYLLSVGAVRRPPTNADLFKGLPDSIYKELFTSGEAFTQVRLPEGEGRFIAYLRLHEVLQYESEYRVISLVALPFPIGTLNNLRSLLLRTLLPAFFAFAVGVWLLSSRALLPLKRMTTTAAQINSRDLSQRVPVSKTNDELKELAVTLNNMLERLQESFETQRRFTADASHELRTPVTAIVGHANYILRRTKPSPEQVDSLTVIRREAERMAKLVNDLLELARADAGFSIQREPMNLVEVIEAVHMDVAPIAGSTDIKVNVSAPLIEVLGDAARLKQVVLNLVLNAVNAGSKHITISLSKEKRDVRLEVLDDGPGIPEAALPHLFDRFYRVDGARSTRGNGSGLGLAIVSWIVQQHGGTVHVESRLGEGSVFTVLLPSLNPKMTETPFLTSSRPPARAQTKPTS